MKKKNKKEIKIYSHDKLRQICVRYERELTMAKDYMFWFLLIWTTILLILEWLMFLNYGSELPEAMTAGYIILLGAYIAHKEINRWAGIEAKVRRGEIFVYGWWATFLAMFLLQYWNPGEFEMPDNMPTLVYEILGYFLFGEVSKALNRWQQMKKNAE